jgi:hypothetical protein
VHGKVSNITVYFPTVQTELTVQDNCDLEQMLLDAVRRNATKDPAAGVFVFSLNTLKVKCDFPGNLFDELDSNVLLSVHKNVWSTGECKPKRISIV